MPIFCDEKQKIKKIVRNLVYITVPRSTLLRIPLNSGTNIYLKKLKKKNSNLFDLFIYLFIFLAFKHYVSLDKMTITAYR